MTSTDTGLPNPLRSLDLDCFDLLVGAVLLVLVAAIAGVALAGDQVGVTVGDNGYAPQGTVSGGEPVRIRFSNEMDAASVEARFRIDPSVAGDFTWTGGHTLAFTPRQPFTAGQTYTVTVEAGAQAAQHGSKLRDPLTWTFNVRLPRAVYLAPSDAFVRHIQMTDLETGNVYQLTTDENGIEDFAVSPNGGQIAYSKNNEDGTTDIWVLDLLAQTNRPVTQCIAALCTDPAWKPDGTQIVYQREDFNSGLGTGLSASRVWIVDLATLQTTLLFDDSQILGNDPTWSPNGRRLAVFDPSIPGIRVHDFEAQTDVIIESMQGVAGAFSPDGSKLVYPVLVRGLIGQEYYTHLEMADFETITRTRISGPEDTPVEDGAGVWSPDGMHLLIARRYLDERFTPGKQLYLLDVASGEVEPVVVDADYNHSGMRWDVSGQRIVFQRFPVNAPGARPEVWTYDLTTGELTQVAENAFLPDWVP
jgi:Tol biopolymer transport system component